MIIFSEKKKYTSNILIIPDLTISLIWILISAK